MRSGLTMIMGRAMTVKMVEASDTTAPKPVRHFANCNKPNSIMYIQQPKGLYSACWGGLMSTRAKHLGAGRVIVDGRVRDIAEHQVIDFPVFARETSILSSNTFTRASEIDVLLQFKNDLWIYAGDKRTLRRRSPTFPAFVIKQGPLRKDPAFARRPHSDR
ncbi:hypothetical protein NW765_017325 [Fusarium oxysporum]|nr:hypothetical protein NW765_017325 [Fusarium oxysporum]KAJ4258671.1 hypothetical protein NW764_016279 [Fusarium oxysporum]